MTRFTSAGRKIMSSSNNAEGRPTMEFRHVDDQVNNKLLCVLLCMLCATCDVALSMRGMVPDKTIALVHGRILSLAMRVYLRMEEAAK